MPTDTPFPCVRLFRGPAPAAESGATLVPTPDGASLIGRGGWRDETLLVFALDARGFDRGSELPLPVPYYGGFGYHDGTALWVGVRDQDGGLSLMREGGTRISLAGALPDTRVIATFDPNRGSPIFAAGGVLYGVDQERLVRVATTTGTITSLLCADDRLVVLESDGRVSALAPNGATLVALPPLPGPRMGTLAWDAQRGAIVTLVGRGDTVPVWLEGGAWARGEPFAARLRYAAMLAFHRGLGRVVVFGGGDEGHSMRGERNEALVLGGPTLTSPRSRRAGRRNVVKRVGETILVINASDLSVERLTPDGFSPYAGCAWDAPARTGLDDRYVRIGATRDGVWIVRHDGSVFETREGRFVAVAVDSPAAIVARPGGDLFWDAPRDRLLLIGGYERNDVWALDRAGWQEGPRQPWDEGASIVETPRGLYAVEPEGEIWHLLASGWGKAERLALPRRTYVDSVVYEPKRDALLLVTSQGGAGGEHALWIVVGHEARLLTVLPTRLRSALVDDGALIVEEVSDRLLFLEGNVIDAVALGALGEDRIGLPEAVPFERPARPVLTRPAARLVPTSQPAAIDAVPISDDYVFLAWLPASELLPLGGHASIAIGMSDEAFAHDTSDPFSASFAVVLLDHAPPGPVVLGARDAVLAELVSFADPDPERLREMDTTSDWDHATKSKIGGYARPVQGGSEEAVFAATSSPCRTCATPMRFVAQLAADLFEIGDAGTALVYVCPNGCDAGATADCH